MKCFNLRAREKKERGGGGKLGEKRGKISFLLSLLLSWVAVHLRLMPAIRLCVANEESARHTH